MDGDKIPPSVVDLKDLCISESQSDTVQEGGIGKVRNIQWKQGNAFQVKED